MLVVGCTSQDEPELPSSTNVVANAEKVTGSDGQAFLRDITTTSCQGDGREPADLFAWIPHDADLAPALQRVAYPENLASHMFTLADPRPEFASATTDLRMFDRTGTLLDAKVTWVRTIIEGPAPQCGFLVQPDQPVRMPLDGPLLPADWTAEVNYLANSDGSLTMSLPEGPEVKVPVRPGLNRVFVRLPGAGDSIAVSANTAALSVCISPGPVGFLAPR
ncbi:hypothetical protein M2272_003052 [Mycobacterium frederiksbergense]|uniref:Uncharacterized protein n=1 Tax=Mycolicibacterium frederiksbergense TaxID=117567 RepID=A0ABT6L0F5_9MYCO|nr:hypothetical protein [Mycolicibacterium frederiksbergense]